MEMDIPRAAPDPRSMQRDAPVGALAAPLCRPLHVGGSDPGCWCTPSPRAVGCSAEQAPCARVGLCRPGRAPGSGVSRQSSVPSYLPQAGGAASGRAGALWLEAPREVEVMLPPCMSQRAKLSHLLLLQSRFALHVQQAHVPVKSPSERPRFLLCL